MTEVPTLIINNELLINQKLEQDAVKALNMLSDNCAENEISPSKNWCLGPWVSTKQTLNRIYDKKINSPCTTRARDKVTQKNRLFSIAGGPRRKMSFDNHRNGGLLGPLKTAKSRVPYKTNIATMNTSTNYSDFTEESKSTTVVQNIKKTKEKIPTMPLKPSVFPNTKVEFQPTEKMMKTIGNSKFKLILNTLDVPNLPVCLQPLNSTCNLTNNPVLTKVSRFYHPKKALMRRRLCKYNMSEREYIAGMKENNTPNIILGVLHNCKY